ncbi:PepSY-associated TM helix domain-containing protein [Maricaulis salignorans]|uniref:PepSY-associated TM helix domain-containing protein n=1 Tax=Maricaulis salignorans TaxID=144026 RepID=UPI003A9425EA
MRTDIVRMYKDIHAWVGIVSGLALFIAFYAGALTMFEQPIQRWASAPADLAEPVPLESVPALIAATRAAHPESARSYRIHVETGPENPARLSWDVGGDREHGPDAVYGTALDAAGALETARLNASPVGEFIDVLHQQVGLPFDHEISMPIMGAVSLLYAIALVSGLIIIIPSLVKDMFALRLGKNLKRMWLDVHNALGIFSLPFHIVMALSAVVFAFHDQFYDAQNVVVYQGELEAQWSQDGNAPEPFDPQAQPLTPAEIVTRAATQAPGFTVTTLEYRAGPDGRLGGRMMGYDPRWGMRGPTYGLVGFDVYTGEITDAAYLPGHQSGWAALVTSFFALHFGNYGGEPVRWGYFLFGLAGAFLFYSGNLLWIETRRKRLTKRHGVRAQSRSAHILGALTVGVALGSIAGISTTLVAAKWMAGHVENLAMAHSWIYYLVFLASIGWAFRRGAGQGGADLLWLCAFTTLLIPVTSLIALLPFNGGLWTWSGPVLLLDGVAAIGAGLFAVLARLTRQRALKGPRDSVWSAHVHEAERAAACPPAAGGEAPAPD